MKKTIRFSGVFAFLAVSILPSACGKKSDKLEPTPTNQPAVTPVTNTAQGLPTPSQTPSVPWYPGGGVPTQPADPLPDPTESSLLNFVQRTKASAPDSVGNLILLGQVGSAAVVSRWTSDGTHRPWPTQNVSDVAANARLDWDEHGRLFIRDVVVLDIECDPRRGRTYLLVRDGEESAIIALYLTSGALIEDWGENRGYTVVPRVQHRAPDDLTPVVAEVMAVNPADGNILVVGPGGGSTGAHVFAMAGLNGDGTPNPNFGTSGGRTYEAHTIESSPSLAFVVERVEIKALLNFQGSVAVCGVVTFHSSQDLGNTKQAGYVQLLDDRGVVNGDFPRSPYPGNLASSSWNLYFGADLASTQIKRPRQGGGWFRFMDIDSNHFVSDSRAVAACTDQDGNAIIGFTNGSDGSDGFFALMRITPEGRLWANSFVLESRSVEISDLVHAAEPFDLAYPEGKLLVMTRSTEGSPNTAPVSRRYSIRANPEHREYLKLIPSDTSTFEAATGLVLFGIDLDGRAVAVFDTPRGIRVSSMDGNGADDGFSGYEIPSNRVIAD